MIKQKKFLSPKKFFSLCEFLQAYGFIEQQKVYYTGPMTRTQVAGIFRLTSTEIDEIWAKKLSRKKNLTANTIISEDDLQELFLEQGYEFEKLINWTFLDSLQHYFFTSQTPIFHNRALVVTIMGHIDHGKTTLIDALCRTHITNQEFGQITQKISGYQLQFKNSKITLIDTPGHEFFSSMRMHGAKITDLLIIVIDGTVGLQKQTLEALQLREAENIPAIIFVNKLDLPNFNFSKVKNDLLSHHLIKPEISKNISFVAGSARQKKGITELQVLLKKAAQSPSLKVILNQPARGIVLDSFLGASGWMTAILVEKGTIQMRDAVIVNEIPGKVKGIFDNQHHSLSHAQPGDCILISGMKHKTIAGSRAYFFAQEKVVSLLCDWFANQKQIIASSTKLQKDLFLEKLISPETAEINIILKFNSQSSEESFRQQMKFLPKGERILKFIQISTGALTMSDLNLAHTTKAYLLTFQIPLSSQIKQKIKEMNLTWKNFDLIYDLWEKLISLTKETKVLPKQTETLGSGSVIQVFPHSKYGNVAGVKIQFGKFVKKDAYIRVSRMNKVICEKAKIVSLRVVKEDKAVVEKNFECGVIVENYSNFKIGDKIELYRFIEES